MASKSATGQPPAGEHERQQTQPRRRTHGRQVAEVDRERAVTDGVGRGERAIEVHALDKRVDTENIQPVSFRFYHRRVVSDADRHPVGWWRQTPFDPGDELPL